MGVGKVTSSDLRARGFNHVAKSKRAEQKSRHSLGLSGPGAGRETCSLQNMERHDGVLNLGRMGSDLSARRTLSVLRSPRRNLEISVIASRYCPLPPARPEAQAGPARLGPPGRNWSGADG